jgi:hypothetical protein
MKSHEWMDLLPGLWNDKTSGAIAYRWVLINANWLQNDLQTTILKQIWIKNCKILKDFTLNNNISDGEQIN